MLTIENLKAKIEEKEILKGLNLNINPGEVHAIMGPNGSGKSTLLDIIMGLLPPTEGKIFIDNEPLKDQNIRAWQRHIAHVPQFIYLSDGTIADNIILGANDQEIDHDRLRKAVSQASLLSLIESWPDKFNTIVGENGVKLSGGQRQRIGIARALYKNANVLILDEATSALDISTEKSIMNSIINIDTNITILIIAHRISTLDQCDQIIKLNSTDSTNSYLKRLMLERTLEDFSVVVANNQTNGRGQRGSVWLSDKGKNLTFSVLKINPSTGPRNQFMLNILVYRNKFSNQILMILVLLLP